MAIHDDLEEVWQPFAAAFADIVRDPASVPSARTVPTSTAAPVTDPAAIRAALAAELNAARTMPAALPMPGLRPLGRDLIMTEATAQRRSALRLTRLSFADGARAAELLTSAPLSWWDEEATAPVDDAAATVIAALGRTADPDVALQALAEIAAAPDGTELLEQLRTSGELRARLLPLLGASVALGEHLVAVPGTWRALVGPADLTGMATRLADAVGADATLPMAGTAGTRAAVSGSEAVDALRTAYRRELVAIAARDLSGELGLRTVTSALADLAGYTLQAALAVAAARAARRRRAVPARDHRNGQDRRSRTQLRFRRRCGVRRRAGGVRRR